jgi:DNA-directed RNA polymerase subunit M
MEFCPQCESRLVLTHRSSETEVIKELICPKCGYTQSLEETQKPSKTTSPSQEDIVTVIGEEESKIRTLPTTRTECPKCGHQEAYWWMVQTRGADESTTQFLRCTKCNYTWRESA